MKTRVQVFIGHFDSFLSEIAVPIVILHIVAGQIEIGTDIGRDDADLTVPALNHDAAAGRVRDHKMAVLPVFRQQDAGFRLPDGFIDIRTIVQHMAKEHA